MHGCLAMLARIHDLAAAGSQFIIATHSPILLAVPDARIVQIDTDGRLSDVSYDDAEPVTVMRAFLGDPARYLHYLLTDDPRTDDPHGDDPHGDDPRPDDPHGDDRRPDEL